MRTICLIAALALASLGSIAAPAEEVISNPSFEVLDADGLPKDWQRVGAQVEPTTDAHSGKRALRFVRPAENATRETGLNRDWTPHNGEQGKMLAKLKGGIRFWYKAVRAEDCRMAVYVIPMSADPIENTGARRATYEIPASHVGDGQWHEAALKYDFTDNDKAKWVHVAVRLQGGAGEMLFDDVKWVEKVGPQIALVKPRIWEIKASGGKQCRLAVDLQNAGDAPIGRAQVTLELPTGLTAEPKARVVPAIRVDGEAVLQWTVSGVRKPGMKIGIRAAAGKLRAETTLGLAPDVELLGAVVDRFLLAPGEETALRVRLRNTGTAAAGATVSVADARGCHILTATEAPAYTVKVLPSQTVETQWRLAAGEQEGPASVTVQVLAQGAADALETTAQLDVTRAARAPARQLHGPVWYRQSGSRVLGEIRAGSKTLAKLPYLARVAFRNRKGEVEYVAPAGAKFEPVRDSDGGTWTFALKFRDLSPTVTRFTCSAKCDQPRQMLAFEAMHLYVNEGVENPKRPEAILNGLEWLVDDEWSSDTLDIKRDHPHRIRYVQHPNMISIPYMSVRTPDAVIGLMWDVHQKWDGEHDRPQQVFASPDRFEGRASHLMGLIAPNCLTGLEPNERLAKEPYALAAGKELALEGEIVVAPGAKDALVVQDDWFKFHKPDPVMPIPQGDYTKWIEWSMGAYTDTLYVPEEKKWLPFLGGPSIWRKPRFQAKNCWELLAAARWSKNTRLAKRFADMANEHLALYNAKPRAEDMGFDFAGVANLLPGLANQAAAKLRGLGEDGAWRFNANRRDGGVFKGRDYHGLGNDGAAELGTCARNAYDVLRYARIAGDADAYWQAVKALEFMKRFTVPRAAQVWEVPVHTPDILAAADAVDAYVEAYRFSGDQQWLDEAKRWARAGIPFIYVWNDERYPWMRYGSVPVWGATWFRGSWFGRVVQWNGLRYAYAILKLHAYDPKGYGGQSWYEWARGITISAMYQQASEGKNKYLWPDAYNCIDAQRANWDFAPSRIVKNVCALTGRKMEPETVIVAQGETKRLNQVPAPPLQSKVPPRIHVTSGAIIERAAWKGDALRVELRYLPKERGYTLIAGLDRPSEVKLDGKLLTGREALTDGDAPGFLYRRAQAALIVRVVKDGRATIEVAGVRYRPVGVRPKIARRIAFEFDGDLGGWVAAHDLADFDVRGGRLVARATGGDPYLYRRGCAIAPDSVSAIVVSMSVAAGRDASLYWTTQDSPTFAEDKTVRFAVKSDGQFHEYRLEVGKHPLWRGKRITAIRLDPTNGAPGARIAIDYIRGE